MIKDSLLQDDHTYKRQDHSCMTVGTNGRRGNGTDTNVLDSMWLSFVHRVCEPSFISAFVSYLSVFYFCRTHCDHLGLNSVRILSSSLTVISLSW